VSILFVFLCLAALYESWSVPFSVILVVPLGVLGAVLATKLRGAVERRVLSRWACWPPWACRRRTRS
jgi:multidrug efflux pump subunit AcrB